MDTKFARPKHFGKFQPNPGAGAPLESSSQHTPDCFTGAPRSSSQSSSQIVLRANVHPKATMPVRYCIAAARAVQKRKLERTLPAWSHPVDERRATGGRPWPPVRGGKQSRLPRSRARLSAGNGTRRGGGGPSPLPTAPRRWPTAVGIRGPPACRSLGFFLPSRQASTPPREDRSATRRRRTRPTSRPKAAACGDGRPPRSPPQGGLHSHPRGTSGAPRASPVGGSTTRCHARPPRVQPPAAERGGGGRGRVKASPPPRVAPPPRARCGRPLAGGAGVHRRGGPAVVCRDAGPPQGRHSLAVRPRCNQPPADRAAAHPP